MEKCMVGLNTNFSQQLISNYKETSLINSIHFQNKHDSEVRDCKPYARQA